MSSRSRRCGAPAFRRFGVAPDGSLLTTYRTGDTTIVLRGRLRRRRVTGGRVEIAYSGCQGAATFTARRR